MHLSTARATALILLILILGVGCSSEPTKPENMPELHPLTLTVVQDGIPVELASVRLIPVSQSSPWNSGGSTDENGIAKIRTHGKYFGVPEGQYRVTITKIEMPQADSGSLADMNQSSPQEATYDLVDPQFTNPSKTPLRLEVTPGSNLQEFDLGAPVRIKRKGPPS